MEDGLKRVGQEKWLHNLVHFSIWSEKVLESPRARRVYIVPEVLVSDFLNCKFRPGCLLFSVLVLECC